MDRNLVGSINRAVNIMSLSARRAWIEMIEEVSKYVVKESLSARRAWIEIEARTFMSQTVNCRSPQGERG